jgi:hypothetical protein
MTTVLDEPTRNLLRRAAAVISSMPRVPHSPGVISGGEPLLCSGAVVVCEAALAAGSQSERRRLGLEIITAGVDHIFWKAASFISTRNWSSRSSWSATPLTAQNAATVWSTFCSA